MASSVCVFDNAISSRSCLINHWPPRRIVLAMMLSPPHSTASSVRGQYLVESTDNQAEQDQRHASQSQQTHFYFLGLQFASSN